MKRLSKCSNFDEHLNVLYHSLDKDTELGNNASTFTNTIDTASTANHSSNQGSNSGIFRSLFSFTNPYFNRNDSVNQSVSNANNEIEITAINDIESNNQLYDYTVDDSLSRLNSSISKTHDLNSRKFPTHRKEMDKLRLNKNHSYKHHNGNDELTLFSSNLSSVNKQLYDKALKYEKKGNFEKALFYYDRLHTYLLKLYGTEDQMTNIACEIYKSKKSIWKNFSKSDDFMSVNSSEKYCNDTNDNNINLIKANQLMKEAFKSLETGDYLYARNTYKSAYDIRKSLLGPNHQDTIKSKSRYTKLKLLIKNNQKHDGNKHIITKSSSKSDSHPESIFKLNSNKNGVSLPKIHHKSSDKPRDFLRTEDLSLKNNQKVKIKKKTMIDDNNYDDSYDIFPNNY